MRFSISTSPDWIANINSSSRLALSTPGTAEDGLLFLLSDLIPRLATELPARAGDRGEGDFFRVFFAFRLAPFLTLILVNLLLILSATYFVRSITLKL